MAMQTERKFLNMNKIYLGVAIQICTFSCSVQVIRTIRFLFVPIFKKIKFILLYGPGFRFCDNKKTHLKLHIPFQCSSDISKLNDLFLFLFIFHQFHFPFE